MRRSCSVLLLLAIAVLPGCEDQFISGRLENRCNGSVPACGTAAACVLGQDQYLRGTFPGGQRVIVRTQVEQAKLTLRFNLIDASFPGTELYVRAFSNGCGSFDEMRVTDINLLELAGNDQILEQELDVAGRGDHAVEFFSDMASEFFFVVEIDD